MDLFNLQAKLTLDSSEYEQGLQGAEGKASGFSKVMGTIGKVGAAAFAAVGTAAIAVGKQSLEAYADFEQLSGGIETLYTDAQGGTQAVEQMMENASNAWKTAGMSANEYMEMAIESSASLINSLGGDVDKASELMDQAIVDMSDNVNKMGTSMEAVQNAYRGFSRGNFTMLDNLALGFAGTKEGMQQLLDKAEEISGVHFDISSYSDIIEAIHVIQTDMGITGTTVEEASKTISGSVNAMKAAWQNLLVGIADDNANFETLVSDFVDSVVTVGQNIIPRVESILNGLGELITQAADKLVPIVVDTVVKSLPKIVESGVKLIVSLTSGLISAIPQLVKAIPDIIKAIIDGFVEAWPQLKQAGADLINMVGNGIRSLATEAWYWGVDLIQNFINGIEAKAAALWDKVRGIAQGVRDFLGFSEPKKGPLSDFHTYAPDMMELFAKGIKDNEGLVTAQISRSFDFGNLTAQSAKVSSSGSSLGEESPIKIVVQSVLDGRVIAENTTLWQRRQARAMG